MQFSKKKCTTTDLQGFSVDYQDHKHATVFTHHRIMMLNCWKIFSRSSKTGSKDKEIVMCRHAISATSEILSLPGHGNLPLTTHFTFQRNFLTYLFSTHKANISILTSRVIRPRTQTKETFWKVKIIDVNKAKIKKDLESWKLIKTSKTILLFGLPHASHMSYQKTQGREQSRLTSSKQQSPIFNV